MALRNKLYKTYHSAKEAFLKASYGEYASRVASQAPYLGDDYHIGSGLYRRDHRKIYFIRIHYISTQQGLEEEAYRQAEQTIGMTLALKLSSNVRRVITNHYWDGGKDAFLIDIEFKNKPKL